MERFGWAIIGGGVVGLSIARSLARAGKSVVLLERHDALGTEQSTHNSMVVHSGVFATPGTLRARLNVRGNALLHQWAPEWGVKFLPSGTLVVARSPAEVPQLDTYEGWGRANGVPDLRRLDATQARKIEPSLAPISSALFAPSGARIDANGLVMALTREVECAGGKIRTDFDVANAKRLGDLWTLASTASSEVRAERVANAGGVQGARVAALFASRGPRIYPCLGEYARVVSPRANDVRSMVYAIPEPGFPGIGVHLTRSTSGELWIGPTAEYLDQPVLSLGRMTSLDQFSTEAASLLPGLTAAELEFAHRGIRAKIVPPGSREPFSDFLIREDPSGSGAIQLLGIESPGLASCLAIGEYVTDRFAGPPGPPT